MPRTLSTSLKFNPTALTATCTNHIGQGCRWTFQLKIACLLCNLTFTSCGPGWVCDRVSSFMSPKEPRGIGMRLPLLKTAGLGAWASLVATQTPPAIPMPWLDEGGSFVLPASWLLCWWLQMLTDGNSAAATLAKPARAAASAASLGCCRTGAGPGRTPGALCTSNPKRVPACMPGRQVCAHSSPLPSI